MAPVQKSKLNDRRIKSKLLSIFSQYTMLLNNLLFILIVKRRNRQRQGMKQKQYVKFRRNLMNLVRRNDIINAVALRLEPRNLFVCHTIWSRNKSTDWWDNVVNGFTTQQWNKNFRVSYETFLYICDQLRPIIQLKDTNMRKAVDIERAVAITLWRLSTCCSYRTVGHLFGVGLSTVHYIVSRAVSAIVKVLGPKHIVFPSSEDLRIMEAKFRQKWRTPGCVGCIDATHIPIISPKIDHTDYFNRKDYHSILLQGVVDATYRFWDISVGAPGKIHDARLFRQSKFKHALNLGKLNSTSNIVCGNSIPFYVLGDAAYPISRNVIKPYPDNGQLTSRQKNFNRHVSRTRCIVENAFGRLKGRWRILLKRNDSALELTKRVTYACVILHNICESMGDFFHDNWSGDNLELQPRTENNTTAASIEAVEVRQTLEDYFWDISS
ncbi:Uncharacterised protein r2_g2256 [Pycnogonum litorale]